MSLPKIDKNTSEDKLRQLQIQAKRTSELARLRLEKLVTARRDGRQIYYSTVDDKVKEIVGPLYDFFYKPVG